MKSVDEKVNKGTHEGLSLGFSIAIGLMVVELFIYYKGIGIVSCGVSMATILLLVSCFRMLATRGMPEHQAVHGTVSIICAIMAFIAMRYNDIPLLWCLGVIVFLLFFAVLLSPKKKLLVQEEA